MTKGATPVAPAQYEQLKQALRELLTSEHDQLIRALREYTLDDIDRSADTMRCLSLDDGREIWRNGYRVLVPRDHGMSRTVPAVVGDCVISLGPQCQVVCWDAGTGKARWLIDLVLDHGATVPQWYAGQCPFVDPKTDRLILAPGGKALVMAVDYRTGKVLWESPNPHGWAMTHVSITPMEFAGRRMYVYCGKGGVAGVAADNGGILWDTTEWQIAMATCPSPVVIGDGRIFFSGGYNAAAMMLQLQQQGGRIVPRIVFTADGQAVRLRAADAGPLEGPPLRRAAERQEAGLPGPRRKRGVEQRARQVRLGPVHDCRRADLRHERQRRAHAGRGHARRIQAARPGRGHSQRPG